MNGLSMLIAADAPGAPAADTNGALLWFPRFNLLRDDPRRLPGAANDEAFILRCWSGWTSDNSNDPDPARWSAKALKDLQAACEAFFTTFPRARLVLRNHHRHVLHDHHTLLKFALRWQEGSQGDLRFMIDPASWLTPQMIPDQEDHLQRIADALARIPLWQDLILGNLVPPPDQDPLSVEKLGMDLGPPMLESPLNKGVLDANLVVKILGDAIDRADRLVLPPGDLDAQVAVLKSRLL